MLPSLSVAIPVLNDATRLRRCLRSLQAEGVPSGAVELIVLDNGSTDESVGVAREAGAKVALLPGARVSEMRNAAAQMARGELLAFIDADHEIVPGWLPAAMGAFADATVGAVGAPYLSPPDGTWVQIAYGRLRGCPGERRDASWLGSGNLVVRRGAFDSVGGFDSSLEACEDVDFCQRLIAAGWRLRNEPGLGSIHHGDPPTIRALFKAEMWRGRDNLRVSLRRLTLRGLPSVVVPVVEFVGVVATPLLVLVGLWAPVGGLSALVLLVGGMRAVRMQLASCPAKTSFVRAFSVAVTYDLARALAIGWRARHRRAG